MKSKWLLHILMCFLGRFAAALAELKVDCWVLNVVPVSGANTLPVIYDRGLLGVMHDWYRDSLLQKSTYNQIIESLSHAMIFDCYRDSFQALHCINNSLWSISLFFRTA